MIQRYRFIATNLIVVAAAIVSLCLWRHHRQQISADSPEIATAIAWLDEHGCEIQRRWDASIRVQVPDLIDPAEAVKRLQQLPRLREVYFFSGEARKTDGPYLRMWEWRDEDARAAVQVFRDGLPEVTFTFWPGAF